LFAFLILATGILGSTQAAVKLRTPSSERIQDYVHARSGLPASSITRETLRFGRSRKNLLGQSVELPAGVMAVSQVHTIRLLAIRVDFLTDRAGDSTSTPDGSFDLNPNGYDSLTVDPPPRNRRYFESQLEAVRRYYAHQSRGKIQLEYDVYPQEQDSAYHLTDTADYGPWVLNQSAFSEAWRFFSDSYKAASAAPDTVPFSEYDVYMVFHAGADFQSDVNGNSPRDLPTFFAATDIESLMIVLQDQASGDTVRIGEGFVLPETVTQDWIVGSLYGVIAHEFAHQLALEDLYNTGGVVPYYNGLPMVGVWSLMDSGHLMWGEVENEDTGEKVLAVGVLPPSLDLYSKLNVWPDRFTRINPTVAVWDDTLRAIQPGSTYVRVDIDEDEFFLLENRQKDVNGDGETFLALDEQSRVVLGPLGPGDYDPLGQYVAGNEYEYDALLPGDGILIWHVDMEARERAYRLGFGINDDGNWRSVALEEADGVQDMGDPSSFYYAGGPYDPFYEGNNGVFGPSTSPSSASNQGADSRIEITVHDPSGPAMRVTVKRDLLLPGWPVRADWGIEELSLTAADLDGDGDIELLAAGAQDLRGDSLLFAWRVDGTAYGPDSAGVFFALGAERFVSALSISERIAGGDPLVAAVTDSGNAYVVTSNRDNLAGWPARPAGERLHSSPVFIDSLLVVLSRAGNVYARSVRDSLADWVRLYDAPDSLGTLTGNLAAGDIDGDSLTDIVAVSSEGHVVRFPLETRFVDPFAQIDEPAKIAPSFSSPSVALADLNRETEQSAEIVITDSNGVWVVDTGLGVLPGWPVRLDRPVAGPVSLGDVDNDGYIEMALLDRDGYTVIIDGAGGVHPGWPKPGRGEIGDTLAGAVLLADVTGDGGGELLFPELGGVYSCLTVDGSIPSGWPISVGRAVAASAVIVPAGTGYGMFIASYPDVYATVYGVDLNMPGAGSGGVFWAMPGGDAQRTHFFPFAALPVVVETPNLIDRFWCFPNPCKQDQLTVYFKLGKEARSAVIEMIDQEGRSLATRRLFALSTDDTQVAIDTHDFASGVYLCKLQIDGETGSETRFFKAAIVH
jgi:M6 family metalloprotease-like protein